MVVDLEPTCRGGRAVEPRGNLADTCGVDDPGEDLERDVVEDVAEELVGGEVGRDEVQRAERTRLERLEGRPHRVAQLVVLTAGVKGTNQ